MTSLTSSFFFRTRSGSYGFARASAVDADKRVTGFRPYYYYLDKDSGRVAMLSSGTVYGELDPALTHVVRLDRRPSVEAVTTPGLLVDMSEETTDFTVEQQEKELLMMEGVSAAAINIDGTVKAKTDMTPMQESVLQFLGTQKEEVSTITIGRALNKPTAGINSALQALKKAQRVSDNQKTVEGKVALYWSLVA